MLNSLFNTFTLKGKTVKNRFLVPAMVTNYCTEDGEATEKFLAYHEKKAEGGWGIIITEDYAVDPLGKGFKYVAGLWDDKQIESHKALPERVHKHGSVVLAQIYHAGRQTSEPVINAIPVAPSPIACPFSPNIPKELTTEEVKVLVGKFGDTALRAKKCGFDGVEIHGGHGYLIAEFMSPYSNKRLDEYGGNLQNRVKFPTEIIKDIRAKCGDDFIICFRISGDEFIEGGRTIEDTKAIVKMLEAAGIDMVHVSAGVYASADAVVPPSYTKHGWIADMAAEVKSVCNIPVITVGRINDPFVADSILEAGKADFVGMARASLIDPELPNKAKAGKFEEIRQCVGCNHGCLGLLFANEQIKCSLNPELGNEHETAKKATSPKKVAVIGAGPAGLEAAIYLAKAGHSVSVFEKAAKAGGQFYLAAVPPGKGEISAFIRWQTTTAANLGVELNFNTEITADYFESNKFDLIIVATGAKPTLPPIAGVDLPHVVTANEVLAGTKGAGYNVVVIGGGSTGADTANHLAVHLKNVTLVEAAGAIASDKALAPRIHLMKSLEGRKVRILTNTSVKEIKADCVVVADATGTTEIPADGVVIATGVTSDNTLANKLLEKGLPVKIIGDANKVGIVLDAVEQGYKVAASV